MYLSTAPLTPLKLHRVNMSSVGKFVCCLVFNINMKLTDCLWWCMVVLLCTYFSFQTSCYTWLLVRHCYHLCRVKPSREKRGLLLCSVITSSKLMSSKNEQLYRSWVCFAAALVNLVNFTLDCFSYNFWHKIEAKHPNKIIYFQIKYHFYLFNFCLWVAFCQPLF